MNHPIRRSASAVLILALLAAAIPVGSTWAWFTDNVSVGIPATRSAVFRVDAAVAPADDPGVPILPDEDGIYQLTPGSYTITMAPSADTTAKGFCTIRSGSGLVSHTNPLTGPMTITLVVPVNEEDPTAAEHILIDASWGTQQTHGITLLSLDAPVCLEDGMILTTLGEVLAEVPAEYEAQVEHSIPRYYQNDYPNNRYGSGSIATDGCGVTALASLATYITGHEYLPDQLARWCGGRAENNIERMEIGATDLGLSWSRAENIDVATAALYEGKLVVMMMDGFEAKNPFTTTQHFLIVRGMTTDGRYLVHDPNRDNYGKWDLKDGFRKGFPFETMVAGYSGAWIFDTTLPQDFQPYHKEEYPRQDNYPGVELTYEEQELIARLIWAEARGECAEGQQAVAEVVLNRLISGKFGASIAGIIVPEQFNGYDAMEDATPWQAQYDALDAARYGRPILDQDVFYFARTALTDQVFMTIGHHVLFKPELLPEATIPEETEPETTEPETTEPETTEPETTEPETTEPETTEPQAPQPETSETQPPAQETEPVRYYQSDYPDTPYAAGTIADSGSSMVCLAMAASWITGYDYTPDQLAAWFGSQEGDEILRMEVAYSTLMLPWYAAESFEQAAEAAAQGKLLILRLESTEESPCPFTSGEHFLLVHGVTEDGKYLITDPSKDNCQQEALLPGYENGFSPEAIQPSCTHAWVLDPAGIPSDFQPYTQ